MRCYIHGGEDVLPALLVEHHVHPTGYGGPDTPDNIVHICATCHDLLHKAERAICSGKSWKAIDMVMNYLPNQPNKRELLYQLALKAAEARAAHLERGIDVEDLDSEEDVVMMQLELPAGLHHRLKTLASSYKHRNGRRLGLYRYVLMVLKGHVLERTRLKIDHAFEEVKGFGDEQRSVLPDVKVTQLK